MKIGDKVTCIDDSNQKENVLVKGQVYTIISFENNGVFLKDTKNWSTVNDWFGHKKDRFRPLDREFAENTIQFIKQKSY